MGNAAITVYAVTWRHRGVPCILDFNREGNALAAAVALAELGGERTDIMFTAEEIEETQEDRERKERIWARLQERMNSDVIPGVFA